MPPIEKCHQFSARSNKFPEAIVAAGHGAWAAGHTKTHPWHGPQQGTAMHLTKKYIGVCLLNEQRLSQLIPRDKRFYAAIPSKQFLYLAILINLLRRKNRLGGQHLQGAGIGHAIALKTFRLLAVKHRENPSAGPQQFRQMPHRGLDGI